VPDDIERGSVRSIKELRVTVTVQDAHGRRLLRQAGYAESFVRQAHLGQLPITEITWASGPVSPAEDELGVDWSEVPKPRAYPLVPRLQETRVPDLHQECARCGTPFALHRTEQDHAFVHDSGLAP
jgi:hypothetical protein